MEVTMSFCPRRVAGSALAVLVISSVSAFAQVTDPQRPVPQPAPALTSGPAPLTVGVKAGVNYSTLALEQDELLPVKPVLGAVGGLFVGRQFSSGVGMQAEALFSQRGTQDDVPGAEATVRLTYIDVPVTVNMGTSTSSGARFYAFTGPQLGIKIKSELINKMIDETTDLDESFKSWDAGWTVGAGAEFNRILLDARYTFGLTDINKTDDGGWAKNRTLTVLVGVRLR
jgi:opacity protein-like surface antigen